MRQEDRLAWEWGAGDGGTERNGTSLGDGSRVAVIGGGPAGSFFCWFLLAAAERLGFSFHVDVYEPRDYSRPGPGGCNHCGGVISESLVQHLAAEGILLPSTVVQRGIDSYTMHTDDGTARIATPLNEKRIAAVSRGAGPKGTTEVWWGSFDAFLLGAAVERGAHIVAERVTDLVWQEDRPCVCTRGEVSDPYDLVAVATGVNTSASRLFEKPVKGYRAPKTARTCIWEIPLGTDAVETCVGSSMHVFLPNIPSLEFAALIPKGDHVTFCLLGDDIDDGVIHTLLTSPAFGRCLPSEWIEKNRVCRCRPRVNVGGAKPPEVDRVVFLGDVLSTRLYKDGIGGAYRAAKAAANTAVLRGVSARDFALGYAPVCRAIERDNAFGKLIFAFTRHMRRWGPLRRAILRMTAREQLRKNATRRMSLILWDLFTGSAPYREVFFRFFDPRFGLCLLWNLAMSILPVRNVSQEGEIHGTGSLGKNLSSR